MNDKSLGKIIGFVIDKNCQIDKLSNIVLNFRGDFHVKSKCYSIYKIS